MEPWEQELYDAEQAREAEEEAEYWRALGDYEDWMRFVREWPSLVEGD